MIYNDLLLVAVGTPCIYQYQTEDSTLNTVLIISSHPLLRLLHDSLRGNLKDMVSSTRQIIAFVLHTPLCAAGWVYSSSGLYIWKISHK